VQGASEEWADETNFCFQFPLQGSDTAELLAQVILERARVHPDLETLLRELTARFSLLEGDAFNATDRALGGVVRAASRNPAARPNQFDDPVAAAAFDIAMLDDAILDDIYPNWKSWRPGPHSKPINQAEQPSTGQPATRPVDEPVGSEKPQPEAEGRSR
jgi:hypothetical protein